MRDLLLVLATALLLRACESVDSPAASSVAPPVTAPQSNGAGVAAGEWRRKDMDGAPLLLFQGGGERPLAALRCDLESGELLVERMTVAPSGGIGTLTVTADNRTRTLPVMWDGATLPIASAALALDDRLVDGLARGSGRMEIGLGDEKLLALPADRRVAALVEECRG